MKLELKHLSPYLPYNLNVLSGDAKEIYQLVGLHVNWQENFNTYDRKIKLLNGEERKYSQNLKYCKPILRPLTDLLKFDITINNEKFTPIEKLVRFDGNNYTTKFFNNKFFRRIEIYVTDIAYNTSIDLSFVTTPLSIYQKLIEWHFDVFGLIENHLAVDFNSIDFNKA